MRLAQRLAWVVVTFALLGLGNAVLSTRLDPYYYDILIRVGIMVVLAVSLNLINGFTGQFSIGHAGFMAVGGYTAGAFTYYLEQRWTQGVPLPQAVSQPLLFLTALLLGGLTAALVGFLVGVPSLRLKGDYLAIVTLGFGEIIRVLILNIEQVGASRGLSGVPKFSNFFWVYLAVVGVILMVKNIVQSAHGRALISVREDEIAAEAIGINTTRYKVLAFVISSAWAGIAGGLHGHFMQGLYPNDFTFLQSIEVVVIVVLGGMGSITGCAVTAALLKILENVLRSLTGTAVVFYLFIFIGAVLSYRRFRERRVRFVLQFAAYTVALTLLLVFARDWLTANIAFLRGVFYALLLILLMLTRPQGLLGKAELSAATWRRLFKRS